MAIIQTPSIANVVEDQTPQLGGDLDCQDYQLQWSGSSQYIGSTIIGAGLTVSAGSNNLTLASSGNLSVNTNSAERAIFQSGGGLSVGGDVAPLSVDGLYDLGTTSLRWANTYTDTITIGDGVDAVLTADAADTLALKNSNNAQAFHVYNTDDGSNYERLEVKWDTNTAEIKTAAAGTGVVREAVFGATGGYEIRCGSAGLGAGLGYNGTRAFYWTTSAFRPFGTSKDLGGGSDRWRTTFTSGLSVGVETFTAASDTLDAKNNVCLCDCTSNAIRLALPAPVSGLQYHIKKTDSTANTVSIEPDDPGPELIDGAVEAVISTQYDSITVVSDGSNWFIL